MKKIIFCLILISIALVGISFVSATDADSVSSDVVGHVDSARPDVVGHVCVSSDVVDSVLGAPALGSGLGGGGDQNYY